MSSDELQDEVISINSIYADDTLTALPEQSASAETVSGSSLFALILPTQDAATQVSLRLAFPPDYPATAPPVILGTQSVGPDAVKGAGAAVAQLCREILREVFTPGTPCIFDLIEEAGTRLPAIAGTDSALTSGGGDDTRKADDDDADDDHIVPDEPPDPLAGPAPPWILSSVLTEKKSIFVARAARVHSVSEARGFLAHLLETDKKVARATHNITAWRIRSRENAGVQYQDCDDDGETAAGGRLLHLLELMRVWDVMVVVTRWYGGVHLGPDRFRLINQCAREAVVRGGFDGEEQEEEEAGAEGAGVKRKKAGKAGARMGL